MKIAICDCAVGFENGWIEKCKKDCLDYVLVNPYSSNIISELKENQVTHFLWHWDHCSPKDWIFARQLLTSIEGMGIKVFPNINTCWYFDDKIGEKYVLEAYGLPMAKTWVFYSKNEVLDWAKNTDWPKVFKLRAGAGSRNVVLVKSYRQCKRLVDVMFGRGIPASNISGHLKGTIRMVKKSPMAMFKKIARIPHYIDGIVQRRMLPKQRGYCLFQEFIANNKSDIRIVVIGDKAFAIRRLVADGDFRASGSGLIDYDYTKIPIEAVRVAFLVSKSLNAQSIALDFVISEIGKPLIVEISYGFSVGAYYKCPGYWTESLLWKASDGIKPEDWILEDLMKV